MDIRLGFSDLRKQAENRRKKESRLNAMTGQVSVLPVEKVPQWSPVQDQEVDESDSPPRIM